MSFHFNNTICSPIYFKTGVIVPVGTRIFPAWKNFARRGTQIVHEADTTPYIAKFATRPIELIEYLTFDLSLRLMTDVGWLLVMFPEEKDGYCGFLVKSQYTCNR